MYKKVGIIGLGLIGGSLARAIKKHDKTIEVFAVDVCRASLDSAVADGNIDGFFCLPSASLTEKSDRIDSQEKSARSGFPKESAAISIGPAESNQSGGLKDFFKGCNIVIVCTGAERVAADINAVYQAIGNSALITDVCSVKDFLAEIPEGARYIGGHPMAGTEKSGYPNSNADLFKGKKYIITEMTEAAKRSGDKDKLLEIVKIIGATPVELDNKTHDRVLARVSHLPHIAAYLLSDVCVKDEVSRLLSGGGFKDTTRIASSDPALWTEIVFANKENVLNTVDDYINALSALREKIDAGDKAGTEEIFKKGKEGRDGIC